MSHTPDLSLIRVFETVVRSEGKIDAIAARLDRIETEHATLRTRVETLERTASEAAGKATTAATVRATGVSVAVAAASGLLFPWLRATVGN